MSEYQNDIPVQEISEILDVVSSKVPKLVSDLMKSLYSDETGKQMGKAVGSFFKELVESGIPREDALAMSKDYLNTLKNFSPDNIMSNK